MVCQASVSDGQLFLLKCAFNPRKANDFLDDALKALNSFWFSWRLASLHWFVLLAVDFLSFFFVVFFTSCLKQVLKVSLLLLRNQRWLKQRGRALESLWKCLLSWGKSWGEQGSLWAVVRKDPALLLDREFSASSVKPARVERVMGCMASTAPAWGHPCSQGQGTFSAHKVPAGVLERGNCLVIPAKLRGHPHPTWGFIFNLNCPWFCLSGCFERPLNIRPVFPK